MLFLAGFGTYRQCHERGKRRKIIQLTGELNVGCEETSDFCPTNQKNRDNGNHHNGKYGLPSSGKPFGRDCRLRLRQRTAAEERTCKRRVAHLCGSASDAAHQQTPSATLTRQRGATLRPRGQPLPLSPLGHRTARGATDERPPTFSSSPCNRQKKERIDNGGTRQRHLRSMDA